MYVFAVESQPRRWLFGEEHINMNQDAYKQNVGVVLAIIGSGVVLAAVAIILFYAMKGNQKIVATTGATTIQVETQNQTDLPQ